MKPNIDFDFDSAVLAFYMEHGKPCTAKEIAEHSGVSIGKVRKAIQQSRYKSDCVGVDVEIKGMNYSRVVDAYQPSLRMMRERIIELEGVVS